MVSGTAPGIYDASEIELISLGGGPHSEAGSFFEASMHNASASEEKRELESAYKDLYNHVHGKAVRTNL